MFSFHGGYSGEFCRHAEGRLGDMVLRAIELGFTHYGLSEHCPRYRPSEMQPWEMGMGVADLVSEFDDYTRCGVTLQERYADRIELLVGFESEYLPPDWLAPMQRLRATLPFEYVVGSVHHLDGKLIDYTPEATAVLKEAHGGTAAFQISYFQAVADMVTQLRPEIVAHLDLVRKFEGPDF